MVCLVPTEQKVYQSEPGKSSAEYLVEYNYQGYDVISLLGKKFFLHLVSNSILFWIARIWLLRDSKEKVKKQNQRHYSFTS